MERVDQVVERVGDDHVVVQAKVEACDVHRDAESLFVLLLCE